MGDVVLLTMSEFGRAVRENGNRGTDHGHANCFFALGGGVKGGKVLRQMAGPRPATALRKPRPRRHHRLPRHLRGSLYPSLWNTHDSLSSVLPKYSIDEARFREIWKA